MLISCFDYLDYRKFLVDRLPVSGGGRGQRSHLSNELGVQTTFVSRVLHGDAHFSLEHAMGVNRFLGHTEAEAEYFLLLLQFARAGSKDLEEFFRRQILRVQEKRRKLDERVQAKSTLSQEDQMTYYSAWHYSAVHVMLLVPRWQTPQAIAAPLQVPIEKVSEVLEFLLRTGLARSEGGLFRNGENRIHLGGHSPLLPRHHVNWRMRAIQAIDHFRQGDLFYSGPICLSESDAKRLHEMLLKFLVESEKIIGPSPEETVYCLGIDFFHL